MFLIYSNVKNKILCTRSNRELSQLCVEHMHEEVTNFVNLIVHT